MGSSILVYDSGLGGLSVMSALGEALPNASFVYVADTAGFPYGTREVPDLFLRAQNIIDRAMAQHDIGLIVIACNTLSTLCLAQLRAHYDVPFVGTVPAIKTAAEQSQTGRFTLLATPRSAESHYSTSLIAEHAKGCVVDSIGAPQLAMIAESYLLSGRADDDEIAAEIAPCFKDDARGKTDTLVLGCTHYPFLAAQIERLSPWPVALIDPAPAIARHTATLWGAQGGDGQMRAYVTDTVSIARYAPVFTRFGFTRMPLASLPSANRATAAAS